MTKIINLFGGPGTGKSTTAALVYAEMKQRGFKVELVREVAKDLLYRRNFDLMKNQSYVFAMQEKRLLDVLNADERHRPDYIVTDSPLLLGVVYCKNDDGMEYVITNAFNSYENVNFLLERDFDYASDGRRECEKSARRVHSDVRRLLSSYPHYEVRAGAASSIITYSTIGYTE